MTVFVDYDALLDQGVSLIQTKTSGFKKVAKNLDVRDFHSSNMPVCDVRMGYVSPDVLAGQNYYVTAGVEIEIGALDLSSKAAAFKIVSDQLNKVQRAFIENPHFGASWDSVILGRVEFITSEDTKSGAFAAGAIAQVAVNVYADR